MARGTGPNAGSSTTCTATSPATSATRHTAAPDENAGPGRHPRRAAGRGDPVGLSPVYDLRAGHAQTLEWLRRSGAAVMDLALSDPLWGRTFDLAYEAEVAALAKA